MLILGGVYKYTLAVQDCKNNCPLDLLVEILSRIIVFTGNTTVKFYSLWNLRVSSHRFVSTPHPGCNPHYQDDMTFLPLESLDGEVYSSHKVLFLLLELYEKNPEVEHLPQLCGDYKDPY